MPDFEAAIDLCCTCEAAFEFFVQPANLLKILPSETVLRFVDVPERLELGSRLEFEISGMGPIQRVLHEIVEFNKPFGFTERQLKGPLKSFVHTHLIESNGSDMITVIDRIEFEPPGGLAGFLITENRILDALKYGFEHRHRELKRILEQAL